MTGRKTRSEDELEQKLKVSRRDLEKVFSVLSRRKSVSAVSHKYLPRMYYDTRDLALHRKNISWRVQYKPGRKGTPGRYEQTVKVELSSSAAGRDVFNRREYPSPVTGHVPEFSRAPRLKILQSVRKRKLRHVFTAAVERRFFEWNLKDGSKKGVVEVAFDMGRIILPHNNKHIELSEIEIELKKGDPALIAVACREIQKIAPAAKIQTLSKAGQGVRFYQRYKK